MVPSSAGGARRKRKEDSNMQEGRGGGEVRDLSCEGCVAAHEGKVCPGHFNGLQLGL